MKIKLNTIIKLQIGLPATVTRNGKPKYIDLDPLFADGRFSSFVCEYITPKYFPLSKTLNSCEKNYDFLDKNNLKYEMKGKTKNGISFIPSSMKGKGRHYNENEYKNVLLENDRYIITDITEPGVVSFLFIDSLFLLKSEDSVIKNFSKKTTLEEIADAAKRFHSKG